MKTRTVILIAIAAVLLLGSVTIGQDFHRLSRSAQSSPLAQSNGPPPVSYIESQGEASAGNYRLTSLTWQVKGASSGGVYRLQGPNNASNGTTCCCTYLPCVKNTGP